MTTVALPHYDMGERAVQRVLGSLGRGGDRRFDTGIELSPCTLVERESV